MEARIPELIRVVIIEDIHEVREGLARLINGKHGFCCVGSYSSMEGALAGTNRCAPGLILTDLGLPGISGIAGIRILHERYPDIPIIALTIYQDDEKVFNALCAGASGYLLKTTSPARLIESLQEAVADGAPMSPEVAQKVVKLFRKFRPAERSSCHLTPQESQLLKLIVEGHYKKTAAHEMGISINTISFHLKNIYTKLQAHSKSEAVAKALRQHLI